MHRRLVTAPIIDEISIAAPTSIGRLRQRHSRQPMRAIKRPLATHLSWAQRGKPLANLIEPCADLAAPSRPARLRGIHPMPPITALARILVPLYSTREPRFRHDRAVPIPALPTLSAANEVSTMPKELKASARTPLTRGQYRDVAAMRDAIK